MSKFTEYLKSIFAEPSTIGVTVTKTTTYEGETNMGSTNKAVIKELDSGAFALTTPGGKTIETYARHRDARRGANRRGLTV